MHKEEGNNSPLIKIRATTCNYHRKNHHRELLQEITTAIDVSKAATSLHFHIFWSQNL